ncbi:hypothetical protein GE061_004166 [Apolygus lucorum]|uniref:SCP domain-containing protein n=1 Tax=Apolygus lucorum TaxID=248454 RepID=A0A8S9X0A0_APOLU|nr:hypothetical protein GE061_004166 [Apolygus lucorum]
MNKCRRWTPPSPSSCSFGMDLTRYRPSLHAHDFTPGGNSRVVMIRKKEQRTFASAKIGQETQFETLTKETVQTFRGNKIERKITSQTRGSSQQINTELFKSLSIINIGENEKEKLKKPIENGSPLSQINGVSDKKPVADKTVVKKKEGLDTNSFALECLVAHNEKRAKHKAPPLRLSKKLCKYSEEWAKHLAATGKLMHRPESAYGENLFLLWSSTGGSGIKGSEPVDNWYAEISDHIFDKEPSTLKTGHFTQVVWLESEELGVGVARSPDMKHIYVVCNYNPPGNFIGSFADNVPPIGGFLVPKPTTNPSLVTNDDTFKGEMLSLHNDYRKRHCVPTLKLSEDLCKYAQDWAEHLAKTNKVVHRKQNPEVGESLFAQWSSKIAGAKDACTQWYSEVRYFTYNQEPRVLNASNFTQMVWKDTKEIGVGRAKSRLGHVYIVANYKPAGNIMGKFIENVFRPP